jgi:L,D-transpeptidase ErfK/SrfK
MKVCNRVKLRFFWCLPFILLFSGASLAAQGYGKILCQQDGYTCLTVKKGQSWQSLWPNDADRDLVMRINRMNIELTPGRIVAVPLNLDPSNPLDYAPFAAQIAAPGEKLVIFDPKVNAWGAYDANGDLVHWGPAAGGKDYCKDLDSGCRTPAGHYRFYTKKGEGCISSKFPMPFGGAEMPYCMFFKGGYALHGGIHHLPGFNASHGCVRILTEDAQWLNQNFIDLPGNGRKGTSVIIKPY